MVQQSITLATADTITDFITITYTVSLNQDDDGATKTPTADGTSVADFTALVALVDAVFTAGDAASDNTTIHYNALETGDAHVFVDPVASGSFLAFDDLIILSGINLAVEIGVGDVVDLLR